MIEMTEEYVPAVWRAGYCDWRSTAVDTATGKPALVINLFTLDKHSLEFDATTRTAAEWKAKRWIKVQDERAKARIAKEAAIMQAATKCKTTDKDSEK